MLARNFEKYLVFLSDILSFNLAFATIFWLRYRSGLFPEHVSYDHSFGHYSTITFVLSLIWIGYFYVTGLYRDWYLEGRTAQVLVVTKRITTGVLVILAITAGHHVIESIRTMDFSTLFTKTRVTSITVYWVSFVVSVNGFRLFVQAFVRRLLRQGVGQDRMLILGANETGERIHRELDASPTMGWKVVGYIDENAAHLPETHHSLPVMGKYSDLSEIIRREHIGGIVISHESTSHNEIIRVLSYVAEMPLAIFIVPDLYDAVSGHFKTSAVHGATLKVLFPEHMPEWEARLKRLMDIVVSALFLVLTLPILALVALLIKLDSRGPVLYSQERVGQYGRRFLIHKFRSMFVDAEAKGPQWAKEHDPRITRIGRLLRTTRLDEIPQLWNVLKGEMSLVGPRPEREHFIQQLKHEVPLYLRRLKMKPGVTGWAQVKHKYDSDLEDVKKKVFYDLWYFENMSLSLDVQILIRTIWVVLTGHGAH